MTAQNSLSPSQFDYPWRLAPDGAAADAAVADLINNLPRNLVVDGRVHAETLLAASGAIAGFAAQRTLMFGLTIEQVRSPLRGFHAKPAPNGGVFFHGDALDRALVPRSPDDRHKLWPLAAGGAIAAGLRPDDLPPTSPMFDFVAGALGSDREGTTSAPGCQFQSHTHDLLRAVWPLALMCFNGQLSGQAPKPRIVASQRWRPVIAAIAANRLIRDTASVIAPRKALTIVMETAIYASKLAPATVEL